MSLPGRVLPLAIVAVLLLGCGSGAVPGTPSAAMSPSPSASPAASPAPSPTPGGITRDQAIAAARAAVPKLANAPVISASVGRFADSVTDYTASHFTPNPQADQLVWRINLGESAPPTGGSGTIVIIDYWTGKFILSTDWIS